MTDLNAALNEASEQIRIFLDEILPVGKPEELYKVRGT